MVSVLHVYTLYIYIYMYVNGMRVRIKYTGVVVVALLISKMGLICKALSGAIRARYACACAVQREWRRREE